MEREMAELKKERDLLRSEKEAAEEELRKEKIKVGDLEAELLIYRERQLMLARFAEKFKEDGAKLKAQWSSGCHNSVDHLQQGIFENGGDILTERKDGVSPKSSADQEQPSKAKP